jgi:formylglycine-generating enzyme required for sulfatase activity
MTDANVNPHPLLDGVPPIWATAWGKDEFGAYASFSIGGVSQRLRWISPGRFWMGAPDGEAGRFDDEGPRRQVTLGSGFWMMDTPVRQSLWQAVMDNNPSRFKSPDRPVENVDWAMIKQFLSRLNAKVVGLELVLPTEAQWEYACRAGGEMATYAGDLELLGSRNAPVLDRIAWYGGNSGVGFELENGHNSSDWRGKQYPDSPSGTHLVGQKPPNAFGLHDMLGNVWELCADHWHDGYDGAPTDGSAWIDDDDATRRVVRGGSWYDYARNVRAAGRDCFFSELRLGYEEFRLGCIGFRCVRDQS